MSSTPITDITAPAHILLVEDDNDICEMLDIALSRNGFSFECCIDAQEAQESLATRIPDLILLDWMLPGISGVEWMRRLKKRKQYRDIPIVMLTAKDDVDDKVLGLDIGADDYITKPFSLRELNARINALLRRRITSDTEKIELGDLALDPASHRVEINGKSVSLSPMEYRLLHFFLVNPERVHSRGQILDQVWGTNAFIEERTVDVHIRRLRKILNQQGQGHLLQTVRGFGYRFSQTNH